jgi:hypothetical protein
VPSGSADLHFSKDHFMKNIAGYFIVLSLMLALPFAKVSAQATPFEGTITWAITLPQMGDDEAHPMTINVKGKKVEVEINMGTMGLMKSYTDEEKKKSYMVMEAMKMGFTSDLPSDSAAYASKDKSDSINLRPTGQKATIAGHSAEEYILKGVKSKGTTVDLSIWAAADFPKEMQDAFKNGFDSPGQDQKQTKAMKLLATRGLVPVKLVAKTDGETAMTMEFVKYEQKKLDDALFVPPTDIKYQPMPTGRGGGTN